jgi:hypothetical protein
MPRINQDDKVWLTPYLTIFKGATKMRNQVIINELIDAVVLARTFPHGSYLHREAMQVIYSACFQSTNCLNPTLDVLWQWVDETLPDKPGLIK